MAHSDVLPPLSLRSVVTREASVSIEPVEDSRGLLENAVSPAERSLAVAAPELVRAYLKRELTNARLYRSVEFDQGGQETIRLSSTLLKFEGWETESLPIPRGTAVVTLQVQVVRSSDGVILLDKRIPHRITSTLIEDGPLELVCEALARVVEELIADLDHLDLASS